jgi:hypothetical protein
MSGNTQTHIDVTDASGNTQTVQVINPINGGGPLKGSPPALFDGNRKKSRGFLLAFDLFRKVNKDNSAMKNPYNRVITALTYMTGDIMEVWREKALEELDDNVHLSNIPETDERLWDRFVDDFKEAFTNVNASAEALTELLELKQGDDLDKYISEFERLAKIAKQNKDHAGTIRIFKGGLKPALYSSIIRRDSHDPQKEYTFEEWKKFAEKQHTKWLLIKDATRTNEDKRKKLYQAFGVRNQPKNRQNQGQNRRTTSQGGDAMDVDLTSTGKRLTEEEMSVLRKENKCFYCAKPGHRANVCYTKKREQEGRGKAKANSPTIKDLPPIDMTPTDISTFLKDNMGTMDEDTKLSIIEQLMPKDFQQALD